MNDKLGNFLEKNKTIFYEDDDVQNDLAQNQLKQV
jgi:hypothetical protein